MLASVVAVGTKAMILMIGVVILEEQETRRLLECCKGEARAIADVLQAHNVDDAESG